MNNGQFVLLPTVIELPQSSINLTYVKRLKNIRVDAVVKFFANHSLEDIVD